MRNPEGPHTLRAIYAKTVLYATFDDRPGVVRVVFDVGAERQWERAVLSFAERYNIDPNDLDGIYMPMFQSLMDRNPRAQLPGSYGMGFSIMKNGELGDGTMVELPEYSLLKSMKEKGQVIHRHFPADDDESKREIREFLIGRYAANSFGSPN